QEKKTTVVQKVVQTRRRPALAATLRPMRRHNGTRIPVAKYLREGWTQQACSACRGTGLNYIRPHADPGPISGQELCRQCQGRGSVWTSPAGRRASYPGGPWLG